MRCSVWHKNDSWVSLMKAYKPAGFITRNVIVSMCNDFINQYTNGGERKVTDVTFQFPIRDR